LVALGGSDPSGGFHLRTLSFGRTLDNHGAHFEYSCYSPRRRRFEYISNSNEFKLLQNLSYFDQSKNGLPQPKKFEIKYSFEDLEKMNNSLHRNSFRFVMEFK
jgi:hypothetical protein